MYKLLVVSFDYVQPYSRWVEATSIVRLVPSTASIVSRWDIYTCKCGRRWNLCGPSWMKMLITIRLLGEE